MSSTPEGLTPTRAVLAILVEVRAMRSSGITGVLDHAAALHGLDTTLDEVVFPTLRTVGTFWESGTLDLAHEHLVSGAISRWMYARLQEQSIRRSGCILLAAGPQDLHVLGLDCLELLLAHRGVEVCNLGGQIPAESLVVVARCIDPVAVVVACQTPTSTTPAVRAVQAVAAAGFPTYYAGSSFESQFVRQHTPGQPLDAPLARSADLLTRTHTSAHLHLATLAGLQVRAHPTPASARAVSPLGLAGSARAPSATATDR